MLRTFLWLSRPGAGYIFMVSLCRVSFCVQPFVSFFVHLFFSFCLGFVLFSKIESFVLDLSFHFFVFYLIAVKVEVGLQKNNLYFFNLVLIWFAYRGFFFLSHAISL